MITLCTVCLLRRRDEESSAICLLSFPLSVCLDLGDETDGHSTLDYWPSCHSLSHKNSCRYLDTAIKEPLPVIISSYSHNGAFLCPSEDLHHADCTTTTTTTIQRQPPAISPSISRERSTESKTLFPPLCSLLPPPFNHII